MADHPSEIQLKKFLLSGSDLSEEEIKDISYHLDFCHLCLEHLDTLKTYYRDLDEELDREPSERDHTLASKIWEKNLKGILRSKTLIKTYEGTLQNDKIIFPSKIITYIRDHPIRSVTITAASVAFGLLLAFVQPWVDRNPTFVEAKKNTIHAYNSEGDLLWNKPAAGIPNSITSQNPTIEGKKNQYLQLEDIDGNGKNELLVTGDRELRQSGGFASDTLYCFNADGSLRWKSGVPDHPPFRPGKNSTIGWWEIMDFFSLVAPAKKQKKLFAFAKAGRWSPSVFYELDPQTGNIGKSYWHSGHIQTAAVRRMNGGQDTELLVGGINDTYNRASLAVLDPQHINGRGPGDNLFTGNRISDANENFYLTFKPSVLSQKFNAAPYNLVSEIIQGKEGRLIIHTRENLTRLAEDRSISIYYVLNSDFKVVNLYGDDNFSKLYAELYEAGKLDNPLTDRFWEDLKDSVLYWDGEKFVSEPVKAH